MQIQYAKYTNDQLDSAVYTKITTDPTRFKNIIVS